MNQTCCREYALTKMEGQFCKQNKLDKSSNFAVNAKHAIVALKAKVVKDSD